MNKQVTKKVVATLTSLATVAMMAASAFLPMTAGAAYNYSLEDKLTDPSVGTTYIGYDVAISADGTRAVLGVGSGAPSAYIFSRSGTSWILEQKLIGPSGNTGFGNAVDISADGSRVVIGANGQQSGAPYVAVYSRSGTTWSEEQQLSPIDKENPGQFGRSVAISDDGSIIIAGAPYQNNLAGVAYVFTRSGTTWTQEQKLVPSDPGTRDSNGVNDLFGFDVDITADGSRAVLGAPSDLVGTIEQKGSAYIFSRSGTIWTEEQKLTAADGERLAVFGTSVSITADGSRVMAGAPGRGNGYAYAFSRSGTTWAQEQKIIPSAGYAFGYDVALVADGSRVIIGARDESDPVTQTGVAYSYSRSGTSWAQEQRIVTATNPAGYAPQFGGSVSVTADGSRALIGAIGDTTGRGAAFVFSASEVFPTPTPTPTPTPLLGSISGRVWDDLDHDGIQDAGEPDIYGAGAPYLVDGSGAYVPGHSCSAGLGLYVCNYVPSGTYKVRVSMTYGLTVSPLDQGGDDTLDNDFVGLPGGSTAESTLFSFDANMSPLTTVDFGVYQGPTPTPTATPTSTPMPTPPAAACTSSPVSVTLSTASGFTDSIIGESGAIYRPKLAGVGLISNPSDSFVYACGPCHATTSAFVTSLNPGLCGASGDPSLMVSKDICAFSVASQKYYTLDVTMYGIQLADPNASYVRYSCAAPTPTPTATPPPATVCIAKPGKVCICHYSGASTQVLEISSNAVKAHLKHGDDTFNELTQVCDVAVEVADSGGSGTGSYVALAFAAVAAGLGIGIYARRK